MYARNSIHYEIRVTDASDELKSAISLAMDRHCRGASVFVLVDCRIVNIGRIVEAWKTRASSVTLIEVDGSELYKSHTGYSELTNRLIELGISSSSLLVVVGGGALGDLGGFVSSTLFRGIAYIHVTILMSNILISVPVCVDAVFVAFYG